jgi:parvulin-like peptidyl-prolyl isomerase
MSVLHVTLKNLRYMVGPLLAVCLLPTAHGQSSTVIAKGGSIELGTEDVRSAVAALPEESRRIVRSNLPSLEQLVRSQVVERSALADAKVAGFDKDPKTQRELSALQQELLTRLWIASHASPPADYPSAAEVQSAYDAARAVSPVEYHLAQIFIKAPDGSDPDTLAAALRKVTDLETKVRGGDFAQLAKEQSEEPASASKGGDLGFVSGDRMLPEVLKVVRGLAPGQVAGPVKTAQGLHFVKLVETRPMSIPPLAQVRDRITADLRARRTAELQRTYVSQLTDRLGISINEIELTKLQSTLN